MIEEHVDNTALFNELINEAKKLLGRLTDKPEETPEATIKALWNLAKGNNLSVEAAMNSSLPELDNKQIEHVKELFAKRVSGIPLGHITKRQQFMGIEMLAGPGALIPRKETELVAQLGLKSIKESYENKKDLTVIDVCTGCGNLASTFAFNFRDVKVFAADLSEDAVALAKENAKFIGVSSNTEFRSGDLLAPFESDQFFDNVDVLTCNPPYISSKKLTDMPKEIISYEPEMAFNGGAFGISILGKLAKEAPRYLKDGGYLCMEVGLGQGPGVIKMFERTGLFELVETRQDEADNIRAIRMKRVAGS